MEPTFGSRLRAYIPVAALPSGIVVMGAIVFALIALIATSSSMAALPATIAQFWLVVNMVPVVGQEHTIGFLPMLPGVLLAWTVARRVHSVVKDRISLADLGVLLACVLLLPVLLTLTAAAMLYDASVVYPVGVPNVAVAVGITLLLHGSAFAIGMGKRLWRALFKRYSVPEWVVDSSALAVKGLVVFGIVAFAAVIISLAIHYQEVAASVSGYSTLGLIGAVVLSILYLPNAVVGAGTILAGSELAFGAGSFSLFGVNMVPLPPVPLAAALPASAHPWAVGFLVVTAIAIVYAVYRSIPRVGPALVAAVLAGLYTLILVVFASGNLGVYGFVGPSIWMTVGFITAWFALVLLLACAVVSIISRGMEKRLEEAEAAAIAEDEAAEEHELDHDGEAAEHVEGSQAEEAVVDNEEEADASSEGDEIEDADEEIVATAGEVHVDDIDETGAADAELDDESAEELVVAEAGEVHDDHVADTVEHNDEDHAVDLEPANVPEEPESDLASAHAVAAEQLEPSSDADAEDMDPVAVDDAETGIPEEADSPEGQWHAAEFDSEVEDEESEDSEYSSEVQQEALEEYESARTVEEEPQPVKPQKKRRRGGIFRRK